MEILLCFHLGKVLLVTGKHVENMLIFLYKSGAPINIRDKLAYIGSLTHLEQYMF